MAEITDLEIVDASNTGRFPENQAPSTVNDGARALEGILARGFQDAVEGDINSTGAANTFAVAANRTIAAYYDGMRVGFHAATANTGASTLNVDAVGAKAITKNHDIALASGDIEQHQYVEVVFSASDDAFQMLSPLGNAPLTTIAAGSVGDTELAAAVKVGTQTITIPALAMTPEATNGAAKETVTMTNVDMTVLAFDASTDEAAQFQIELGAAWALGTLTFAVHWTSVATDTDGVAWALQAVAVQDGDDWDTESFGTAVVVTDAAQSAANTHYKTAVSGAVTIGGTPANGNAIQFRLFRDVSDGGDTMTEDARLEKVVVYYTTDRHNDD